MNDPIREFQRWKLDSLTTEMNAIREDNERIWGALKDLYTRLPRKEEQQPDEGEKP